MNPNESDTVSRQKEKKKRRGFALLISLWIIVFLSIIAAEFAFQVRVEVRVSQNHRDEIEARFLAMSAINRALVEILEDFTVCYVNSGNELIFFYKSMAGKAGFRALFHRGGGVTTQEQETLPTPPRRTGFIMGHGVYGYEIIDEERKFSLNSIGRSDRGRDAVQMRIFRNILKSSGLNEGVVMDTICDSVVDWLDPPGTHRLNGAEDDWYMKNYDKQGFSEPYEAKDGHFSSVEELLMVRGVTPAILYGIQRMREMKGADYTETALSTSLDGTYDEENLRGIVDYLTVHSSKNINANTADPIILWAINEDLAKLVLTARRENRIGIDRERGTLNVVVSSKTFTIKGYGHVEGSGVTRQITAIIQLSGSAKNRRIEYLQWQEI